MDKPHCGHCKKTLAELTWQTGGKPSQHYCIEKAKLDQEIEKRPSEFMTTPIQQTEQCDKCKQPTNGNCVIHWEDNQLKTHCKTCSGLKPKKEVKKGLFKYL